jgi:hypothetical protein
MKRCGIRELLGARERLSPECKAHANDLLGAGRLGQDDAHEHDGLPDDLNQVQALAEPQPGDQEGEDHLGWRSWQSRPAHNRWCRRMRAMKGSYHANSD